MQIRKDPLATGSVYHVYSRSIAGYEIFNNIYDYSRMIEILLYYSYVNEKHKYSTFARLTKESKKEILDDLKVESEQYIRMIAYCIMPTHIHLILEQDIDCGISKYVSDVLNSYSRYFNVKYKRQGPLWSGRFKNVLISSDEQLLHLTRYIHLNPISAGLTDKPENWMFSSYNEYLGKKKLCDHDDLLEIDRDTYKKFVDDRKDYQKQLALIKSTMIEDYSG